MRRRRAADEKRIAARQDDLARLDARIAGLAVEEADLLQREKGLTEKRAAAYVGEVSEEEVERERDEIEVRLGVVAIELGDLRGLVAPIQRRLCEARLRQAEEGLKVAVLDDEIAAEALAKAETALADAQTLRAERDAALEAAERARDRAESDLGRVRRGEATGVADPLAEIEQARAETAEKARRAERATVSRAVEQIADGRPRAAVLANVPEHLLAEVERRASKWTPETIAGRARERAIARAEALGQGLIIGGEVVVEPQADWPRRN